MNWKVWRDVGRRLKGWPGGRGWRRRRPTGWKTERFFALPTEKQLRRGVHRSTQDIDSVNANPGPFRWTKSAAGILAAIKRFCLQTLDTAQRQQELIKTSESGH